MKRRLKKLETGTGDNPERMVSAREQHDFALKLHRVYGLPGEPEPRLEDFAPRPQSEIEGELLAAIDRVYGQPAAA